MDRACVYNRGCNFRCRGCAYKLKGSSTSGESAELSLGEIKAALVRLAPRRVHFLGGEPTTNPMLPELSRFVREKLRAVTKVGHTNGSGRIPDFIDEAAFSIKAYTSSVHEEYTGCSNAAVLRNFEDAYERGIRVSASTVLIPGLVDVGEVEGVARFVGGLDRGISFHITAYIPVPGAPYQPPSARELSEACLAARRHVDRVTCRWLSREDFFSLKQCDWQYGSLQVA